MHSKLLNLIIQLTLAQKRDLYDFMKIRSNRLSKRDQEVFTTLLTQHSSLGKKEENKIWNQLLTSANKQDKNRVKNRLLKSLERYLCMLQMDGQHSHYRDFILTEYYTQLKVGRNASLLLRKSIKRLHNDINFEHKIYLYWQNELALNLSKDLRRHDESLAIMESSLNDFYIGNRLRIICEITNRKGIVGIGDRVDILEAEITELSKKTKSEHILIYSKVFKLIHRKEEKDFAYIEHYLIKNQALLSIKITKELYSYLMNFCIQKLNQGDILYAQKYLDYFDTFEKRGLLLENNTLSISRLQNSIVAAIITNKFQWARQKIHHYGSKLPVFGVVNRQEFVDLNLAVVELHSNNLEECEKYAKEFRDSNAYNKDIYYRLYCDKILLKVDYLIGNDKSLIASRLRGIKHYIKQNKFPENRIRPHLFFLKLIEKLINNKEIDEQELRQHLLIPDYIWYRDLVKKNGAT